LRMLVPHGLKMCKAGLPPFSRSKKWTQPRGILVAVYSIIGT